MKAIILAAGIGERLLPLTKDTPKCLLKLEEVSILEHQLQNLKECGISDIIVITGHGAEKVKEVASNAKLIHNEDYATTNNIYSLWLSEPESKEGFLLLNGDVVFHKNILRKLIDSEHENALSTDTEKQLGEEEMKVMIDNGTVKEINKTMNAEDAHGEYIGIAKFSKQGAETFFKKIKEFVDKNELGVWYENAMHEVLSELNLKIVSTGNLPWIEIDNHVDLENAKIEIFPKTKE